MGLRARRVLEDANEAIALHRSELSGPAFRTSWFCVVGLLRAVGHVLKDVDAVQQPEYAKPIALSWAELLANKPEPAIFWSFIVSERNRFLKNYEHGIVRLKVFRGSPAGGQALVLDLANATGRAVQAGTSLSIPDYVPHGGVFTAISDGPFGGRPEREVAMEAARWWDAELKVIEAAAPQ